MRRITYFKRFRMELDLRHARPPAELPPGFRWVPWHDIHLDLHAEVKCHSFRHETDAVVFPNLASVNGCRELMIAIRARPGFCPAATWLVATDAPGTEAAELAGCLGTVQGVIDEHGQGAIQNLGVLPEFRGKGLGKALLLRALAGFAAARVRRAYLEVTACNGPAVRMYRDLGFRNARTLYRGVEVPEPEHTAYAAGL